MSSEVPRFQSTDHVPDCSNVEHALAGNFRLQVSLTSKVHVAICDSSVAESESGTSDCLVVTFFDNPWLDDESYAERFKSLPASLAEIYNMHRSMQRFQEDNHDSHLVVSTGSNIFRAARFLTLLAGHLILGLNTPSAKVQAKINQVLSLFCDRFYDSPTIDLVRSRIDDSVAALDVTGKLEWVSFNLESSHALHINLKEYLHYDDGMNGALHLIHPSRLLVFRTPSDLSGLHTWMDLENGQRIFSAAHYVEIFNDFEVQLVVHYGPASYDTNPLSAAGIEVEELPVGPTDLLAAVDRFLTLCTAVPGCVALELDSGSDQDVVEALVAAYLMRRHGFPAAAAVAWIRMVHPPTPRTAGPCLRVRGSDL